MAQILHTIAQFFSSDESTYNESDINVLDEKVNSLLTQVDGVWTCKVCGKTALPNSSGKKNLRKHIEIHIEGISLPCGYCGKLFRYKKCSQFQHTKVHFRSRNNRQAHKTRCKNMVKVQKYLSVP